MPIEIYASKFAAEPAERYETTERVTVAAWLRANVPSFEARENAPISVTINGQLIESGAWDAAELAPSDSVSICVEPKGSALESIFRPGPLAKLFGLGNPFAQPKAPTAPKNPGKGQDLDLARVKGNQVSLNAVIPEIAGRFKRYPDYLLPAHRYFGAPREHWIEMLLCIGKGKYDLPASRIRVGDTPIISLGEDAEFAIYQPGADLSEESAANWWHSASEVGATSTGTAGLELNATYSVAPDPDATAYGFVGFEVGIPPGAGEFPEGWAAGMIVRIEVPYPYTVVEGGASRDIIQGDLSQLAPFPGMQIEIIGDNAGFYQVETFAEGIDAPDEMTLSYVNGGAVTGLKTGSVSMGIGYAGLRYRLTAAGQYSISVDRLTDEGATDSAWPGFLALTTSGATLYLDGSTQEGAWAGPFSACPDGETTQKIEWDVMFPQGLSYISQNSGNVKTLSVTTELQYRDRDTAGEWTSIKKTYTGTTLDTIGFTELVELPEAIRPEVRMRRIGAKSTKTNYQDVVQWYGLKAQLPIKKSYEGVTVLAVRVRGGDRLASQSENLISVEPTRVLPVRNGNAWDVETPTRDIVPWVIHVAHSIGYTDDDLDMAELDRLHAIWTARGDYYDAAIESAGTVKQSLLEALQAGFADFTIDRGLIRPVRDEPRTVMEHPYTPQNMTKPLTRQFSALKPDDFDGVDVEYVDSHTWQKETVQCRLPGDAGLRVEKLKLDGVTGKTQAWRIGMRRRMEQKYRRWSYSFGTELDALNSRYLSYVPLQDDVPGYGQSAIMLSYDNGIIESSEPFDWSAGGAHVVGIRRPDGTLSGPYAATRIDDYLLSISGLDFEPDTSWSIEPPHLLFGPVNRWSYPALITSISPSGTDGASVEAVNYAPEVYAYDDATPPA
ncbi:host specificity factor TipJ family phage tail protein [Pseudomonas sp. PS1]|uniref:Host specificity factor TipJ family phage tail protein n=1 Tax=Stutzerimonas marianensis TaxID=2929513 RepID=A0A9X1W1G2_9GAMM|nr:host specificity factor TipJ family phage tail protein [Pseudomonas marianensis]MCJ0972673.1 host specificity factor TipJ family phage tail protein [Pseudomonas marianensis]